ncbi:hypothetical protein L7F22_051971 [Adiantum nelumboides]|nr:hypothetical protein [Adiantum nelumboides]
MEQRAKMPKGSWTTWRSHVLSLDGMMMLQGYVCFRKAEAKVCFNTLLPANRGDWAGLRVLFLAKFGGGGETSESLWGKVCELRQGSLFEYNVYELQFVELWEWWVASLRLEEAALDFLKKDRFVASLCPPLREKLKGRFPMTWMDAKNIAHLKERKIRYQLQQKEADQEEEEMAPVSPTNAPAAHRGQGNQDQQELLNKITHQLEDFSSPDIGPVYGGVCRQSFYFGQLQKCVDIAGLLACRFEAGGEV